MISKGEETLALHIRAEKLPEPEREYRFHDKRRWRFDFAWPEVQLAVEVEGLGQHHHGYKGYTEDCVKYNEAAMQGWRVLRYTPKMVKEGAAINQLREWWSCPFNTEDLCK